MTPSVLVIGELNVDIVLSGLASPPRMGSEVLAERLSMVLGSASAIFASGAARLGHPVTFVSKVGDDDFGRFCLGEMRTRCISTDLIQTSTEPTGATVVLSTREDRALVTSLGAIADLAYADLPANVFEGHRHLHLSSYFLQSRLQPDFARIARKARERGLSISFDPNSDPDQAWSPALWEVIAAASIVFLNEPEALALTRTASLDDALTALAARTETVVVKLGARGAVAARGRERVHCDGFTVNVVDTTGAGDSFAAGFVHAVLLGHGLKDCLQFANAAGALSATGVGGTAAQPDAATLHSFLAQHNVTLEQAAR